jgi:hypothetical protein
MTSNQISFSASTELRTALEAEAYRYDETMSACLRRIVAEYLRDTGRMGLRTAPSHQLGATNRRYRLGGRA